MKKRLWEVKWELEDHEDNQQADKIKAITGYTFLEECCQYRLWYRSTHI